MSTTSAPWSNLAPFSEAQHLKHADGRFLALARPALDLLCSALQQASERSFVDQLRLALE